MRVGYACQNWGLKASTNNYFKLASYSEEKLIETIEKNLDALQEILEYNKEHGFEFLRIGSNVVPFASHEVCLFDWQSHFKDRLAELGKLASFTRISMHPDQFVLINSPREDVVEKSIAELQYHCDFLDLMGLDETAKVQIHVGGVYGDKPKAIARFVENYNSLPESIKRRLAIENDDKMFSLKDCLEVHKQTGIPIIFDSFHHECLNEDEPLNEAIKLAANTWKKKDGLLMMDYSSQDPDGKFGKHTPSIEKKNYLVFLEASKDVPLDVMLEIKDKETSAEKALQWYKEFSN